MKRNLFRPTVWALLVALMLGFPYQAGAWNWETELTAAMERAQAGEEGSAALLDIAIQNALEQGAPACEIMKMASEQGLSPYPVLVAIYSQGSVSIDELCMCSTEMGISTAVIARAARDASLADGTSVFTPDEVAQSVCLLAGLPYTPVPAAAPPMPDPPDPIPPDSVSSP